MTKKGFLLCIGMLILLTQVSAPAGTVAYWRFEEGPAGAQVPHGGFPDGDFYAGALDSSGNNNHLSVWAEGWAGYAYRTDVATPVVPLTGVPDDFSVQNTGGFPGMFTNSPSMQSMEPAAFTIEMAFKPETGGWRTYIGRDSQGSSPGENPALAALYLQVTPEDALAIKYSDVSGFWHQAQSPNGTIQGFDFPNTDQGRWYYVAAVSDSSTLSLYLADVEAKTGYQLVAQTDLTLSGSPDTALTSGTGDGGDWDAGNWTVGRGLYDGGHADRGFGFINEVRISDSALTPDDFLFSGGVLEGPDDQAVLTEVDDTVTFTVDILATPYEETLTNVVWYKDSPSPDTQILEDGVKYVIDTGADQSTLTIYDVTGGDIANYHAEAVFSDASVVDSTNKASLTFSSGLVHRWSFTGDLTDSVGGADASLYDPNNFAAYVDGGTQLWLDNPDYAPLDEPNVYAYVDLPDGIISALDNYATIEIWMTPFSNQEWTAIMAFGEQNEDPFTGADTSIFMQMNRAGDSAGPTLTSRLNATQSVLTSAPALTLDEQVMLTVVWNGNTNTVSLYRDGALVNSQDLIMELADLNDVDNWLGLGFWNDPLLNWQVNEVRIYDFPLPNYFINAHYEAGPDTIDVELRPSVSTPEGVAVYPALRDDDEDSATLTAAIFDMPAGTTVTGVEWYLDPDPDASGDEMGPLPDDAKYDFSFTQTETSLTVNNVEAADEAYYYAVVQINTGATAESGRGKLSVSQGLVHRWSFNGDLVDSIGGADGTLYDPADLASFVDGGTQLQLDNPNLSPNIDPNGITYVQLPAGIISALEDYATIEMWVTPNRKLSPTGWTNMFAFGEDADGDPQDYTGGTGIIGTLQSDFQDAPLFSYEATLGSVQRWLASDPVAADEEFLFAMVWDGNNDTGTLYVIDNNGTQVASASFNASTGALSDINDVDNRIGMNWWNDIPLNANINEMRIYDWPFDAPWIEEHYAVGPEVLDVNPCLEYPQYDLDGDCQVSLPDFVLLSSEWLSCGRLEPCN